MHARHVIGASGERNLNDEKDVIGAVKRGKYCARHYIAYTAEDADLRAALKARGRTMHPGHTYRYEMICHNGAQQDHPDEKKFGRVIVKISERVVLFADPTMVLRQKVDGTWARLMNEVVDLVVLGGRQLGLNAVIIKKSVTGVVRARRCTRGPQRCCDA